MSDVRTTVLQGEILMLLHDIGKLHWRFVGSAIMDAKGLDLNARHTLLFLAGHATGGGKITDEIRKEAIAALESDTTTTGYRFLRESTRWHGGMPCLGSLLALHHLLRFDGKHDTPKLWDRMSNVFADKRGDAHDLNAVVCAMYADTTDSLFSKGDGLYFEAAQASDRIHLARPLGGVEHEISQERVNEDAKALADALQSWAEGVSTWVDDTTLVTKRDALRAILKEYGVRNLAETRLPNNDVSLWQHSYASTAIFKALLASCLLRGSWDSLLDKNKMVHAKQHLALLAVRWDDAAYVARSVRSWEIVGRRAQLHQLAEEIKTLVENTLCLGNEIYRDNQGICFLVPDLHTHAVEDWAQNIRKQLDTKLDNLCNGGNFEGELRWKLQLESCGLRMTDMLHLWSTSFDEIRGITPTANAPQWQKYWRGTTNQQICPRCGLRPTPWSASRTGGDSDKGCCKTCDELRQNGKKVIDALREGEATDFSNYGQEAFGVGHIPNVERFWQLIDWKEQDSDEANSENRLALVQGIMPLDSLYDASLFDELLAPLPEGYTWQTLVDDVSAGWKQVYASDVKPLPSVLTGLLGGFGGEADGWCSDAEKGHYQRRWIDNLIFKGELEKATTEEKWHAQAEEIIIWALRRHPAPSRMARVWEQTRDFMRGIFALANELNTPFVPLTCDAGTFQILLPAGKALRFLRHVVSKYEEVFGRVRHLLPLHLSAGVFYHKAPLYIAMDAARRFRRLAEKHTSTHWTLVEREDNEHKSITLCWQLPDGRQVSWDIPSVLPDGRPDPYHTWLVDEQGTPTPLAELTTGKKYRIRPSTFDFEVLDASTRRYDVHADTQGRRRHFMMPYAAGPRPYPLEELARWGKEFAHLFGNKNKQSQLKNALELVARLHTDWKREDAPEAFDNMLRAILCNCLPPMSEEKLKTLVEAARDGTFFDLFEWYDFIDSTTEEKNA